MNLLINRLVRKCQTGSNAGKPGPCPNAAVAATTQSEADGHEVESSKPANHLPSNEKRQPPTKEAVTDAVSFYQADGFLLNQQLRGKTDYGPLTEQDKTRVEALDHVTSSPIGEKSLYRGIGGPQAQQVLAAIGFDPEAFRKAQQDATKLNTLTAMARQFKLSDEQTRQLAEDQGIDPDANNKLKEAYESAVGKEVHDKGYVSTSARSSLAQEYVRDHKEDPNRIMIRVRTGPEQTGANLAELLKGSDAETEAVAKNQAEYLLPRGTRFKVIGISEGNEGGWDLQVQALPPSQETSPGHKFFHRSITKVATVGTCKPGQNPKRDKCRPASSGPANKLPATGTDHQSTVSQNVGAIAASIQSVTNLKNAAVQLSKTLGQKVWDRLPRWMQKSATKVGAMAGAVEHQLNRPYKAAQAFAKAIAQEKGLSPEHVDRVARCLAVADGIKRWTTNIPAAHFAIEALHLLGGPVAFGVAKVGYYVPVASLGYVAYSLGRESMKGKNPISLIAGARKRVAAAAQTVHKWLRSLMTKSVGGEGTCKPGERADLTHCTPASGGPANHLPESKDQLDRRSQQIATNYAAADNRVWGQNWHVMDRPDSPIFNEPSRIKAETTAAKVISSLGKRFARSYMTEDKDPETGGGTTVYWVNGKQKLYVSKNPETGDVRLSHPDRHGHLDIKSSDSEEEAVAKIKRVLGVKPKDQHGQKAIHRTVIKAHGGSTGPRRVRSSDRCRSGPDAGRLRPGVGIGRSLPGPQNKAIGRPVNRLRGLVAKCLEGENAGKPGPCPNAAVAEAVANKPQEATLPSPSTTRATTVQPVHVPIPHESPIPQTMPDDKVVSSVLAASFVKDAAGYSQEPKKLNMAVGDMIKSIQLQMAGAVGYVGLTKLPFEIKRELQDQGIDISQLSSEQLHETLSSKGYLSDKPDAKKLGMKIMADDVMAVASAEEKKELIPYFAGLLAKHDVDQHSNHYLSVSGSSLSNEESTLWADSLETAAAGKSLTTKIGTDDGELDIDYNSGLTLARVQMWAHTTNYDAFICGMASDWSMSGSGMSSQHVLHAATKDDGPNAGKSFWQPEGWGRRAEDVKFNKDRTQTHVRKLQEATNNFYKAKFGKKKAAEFDLTTKEIVIQRGVGGAVSSYLPSPVESWTIDKGTPGRFGKLMAKGTSRAKSYTVLTAKSNYANVLFSYETMKNVPGWPPEKNLKGKKEFVMLGGALSDMQAEVVYV